MSDDIKRGLVFLSVILLLWSAAFCFIYFSFHSTPSYYVIQLSNGEYTWERRRPFRNSRYLISYATEEAARKSLYAAIEDDLKPRVELTEEVRVK